MNKETPVTPIDGYISLQCSAGRHHACRGAEWSCTACPCHQTLSEGDASVSSVDAPGDVAPLAPSPTGMHGPADETETPAADGAAHRDNSGEAARPQVA